MWGSTGHAVSLGCSQRFSGIFFSVIVFHLYVKLTVCWLELHIKTYNVQMTLRLVDHGGSTNLSSSVSWSLIHGPSNWPVLIDYMWHSTIVSIVRVSIYCKHKSEPFRFHLKANGFLHLPFMSTHYVSLIVCVPLCSYPGSQGSWCPVLLCRPADMKWLFDSRSSLVGWSDQIGCPGSTE